MEAQVATALAKFKDHPHLEVEFRLGKIFGTRFVAGVSKEHFHIIEKHLSSNPKWTEVVQEEFIDTMGHCNTRMRTYPRKDPEVVTKHRLQVIDIHTNANYDVRCAISQEVPFPRKDFVETAYKAVKQRNQRVHKFWAFDTTRVTRGAHVDHDSDAKCEYHVEVELRDPEKIKKTSSAYIADYGMLLVKDLLKMTGA